MQKIENILIHILAINIILLLLSIIVLDNITSAVNQVKEIPESNMLEVSSNKNDKNLENVQGKIPVTKIIYWALQDNDKDDINETLVISNSSVNGNESGSIKGSKKFKSSLDVPWVKVKNYDSDLNLSLNVTTIKIEGLVAPSSTSYWFSGVGLNSRIFNVELSNLNVSNVTDMSHMFEYTGVNASTFILEGLSNWNISNVIDMSYMFYHTGQSATTFLVHGVSNWDTAKVTNITDMFAYSGFSKRN